ncbi:Ppp1r14c [Phodopus roborovskii]|uniref:Protein phosphatase 1 regulatory subunit 14 n=1 Tax=Phodopus roborovskii TaxID=109678 RepID=A0AAV0A730_PHORO|nr:Ppp1r14c [Phodopus roborovskii]
MSVVTGGGEAAGGAGGSGARVFFQSPRGGTGGSPGSSSGSGSSREDSAPVTTVAAAGQVQQQQRRHQQGKVTVKYDRKELRKRLVLEEWIVEQLGQLYGCEGEHLVSECSDQGSLDFCGDEEERCSQRRGDTMKIDCISNKLFLEELLGNYRRTLNAMNKPALENVHG